VTADEVVVRAPHPVILLHETFLARSQRCIAQGFVDINQMLCCRRWLVGDSNKLCEKSDELDV
jgi:hypothetical protein